MPAGTGTAQYEETLLQAALNTDWWFMWLRDYLAVDEVWLRREGLTCALAVRRGNYYAQAELDLHDHVRMEAVVQQMKRTFEEVPITEGSTLPRIGGKTGMQKAPEIVEVAEALKRSGHRCTQAGCGKDATALIMESNQLSLLFGSGAGLVCSKHARDMERVGGVIITRVGV